MGEYFYAKSFFPKTARIGVLFVTAILGISCAEKEIGSKAHPSTGVNDIFGIDNGMPIREVQKKQFYFKKCELESRRAFPTRVEFSCNEN
ncbi:MAG: hypothetical protein JNM24_05085 [Bdellovibrionaceae bacterium]|nr:hypothetical protein [Pseudobdellovibrionaceae bacterium]